MVRKLLLFFFYLVVFFVFMYCSTRQFRLSWSCRISHNCCCYSVIPLFFSLSDSKVSFYSFWCLIISIFVSCYYSFSNFFLSHDLFPNSFLSSVRNHFNFFSAFPLEREMFFFAGIKKRCYSLYIFVLNFVPLVIVIGSALSYTR